jgi:predicted transposase YbfD/YdcC
MARRPTLVEFFGDVTDPRVERSKQHSLVDILVLSLCAVIAGADNFTEIEEFGRSKAALLRQWLDLPGGIPSHDTLSRVFARLDPESLRSCFLLWVETLRESLPEGVVAVDGKTIRRSFDKASETSAIHVVSAWASSSRLVLGQVKASNKSNEITAIPVLLEMLSVPGYVVTIDAIGCQKKIAAQIRSKDADYVLALKRNQPSLHDDVVAYFADAKDRGLKGRPVSVCETWNYEHGRQEMRRCYASSEVGWLEGRDSEGGDWAGLKSIVMLESERTVGGETSYTRRYYIASLPADAERIGKAVRAHWSIENQLHWSLDVSFNEDQSRIRKDNAPENFAMIRHLALSLLKRETTSKRGVTARRRKAGWDDQYLLQVIAG